MYAKNCLCLLVLSVDVLVICPCVCSIRDLFSYYHYKNLKWDHTPVDRLVSKHIKVYLNGGGKKKRIVVRQISFINWYKPIQVRMPNVQQAQLLLSCFILITTLQHLELYNWQIELDLWSVNDKDFLPHCCNKMRILLALSSWKIWHSCSVNRHALMYINFEKQSCLISQNPSRGMVKELPSQPWTCQHCLDVHSLTCYTRLCN